MSALRRRPHLAAALLLAAAALLFAGPGLLPGRTLSNADSFWFHAPWLSSKPADLQRPANPEIDDIPSFVLPFLELNRDRMPDVPLWNPYITTGRPYLANAQSAVFSLFTLPVYALGLWTGLGIVALLKLWGAAFGTYLLARALGIGWAGGLLAGLVYGLNLWLVTWLPYPHASVWALIPWMLLAAEHVIRRPGPLPVAGLAAATGLVLLSGHPESAFHAAVATGCFAALRVVQQRREGGVRRPVLALSAGLVGGLALAALVVLPFAELVLLSSDIHQRAGSASDSLLPRRYALGALMPDYWGRPTKTPLELFLLARAVYAGILPLLLAAIAVALRPRGTRLALALFGAACLLVVFGIPPVFQVVTHLPIFSSGHNTRLVALAMLCVALLAGWGLDDLLERARPMRPALVVVPALVATAGLAVFVAGTGRGPLSHLGDAIPLATAFGNGPSNLDPDAGPVIRLAALLGFLVLAAAAVALVAARMGGRLRAAPFAAAACVLVVVDLAHAGLGYNPSIKREHAEQPATGAIRHLQTRRPGRFVSVGDIPQDAIPLRFRLEEARGYDLPIERRFDTLWRRTIEPEFPSQVSPYPTSIPLAVLKLTPARLDALRRLGVTDVLQPPGDPVLRLPGLRLAYRGRDARVYAVDGALPRAWVAGSQKVVRDGDAALAEFMRRDGNPRVTAVTEERVPGVPTRPVDLAGGARITHYEPERVTLTAQSPQRGLLVLGDLYYPGWKARVDGRETKIYRVNSAFRGVAVPGGRHEVSFTYEPRSWRAGWAISLLALAGLAGAVVVGVRRRRRR